MSLSGYNLANNISFDSGIYHHVALTISGNTHTIYLDGSAVATNATAGNIFNYYNTIQQLYIGCAGDLSYGFKGYIDDFKVFNRALPSSDISAIYNTKNDLSYSNPIASSSFSSDICFNQICITDNGKVAIATTRGVYYSTASANSIFTLSDLSANIVSMSMNNTGNALCCTNKPTIKLYYSTNYGVNWTLTAIQPTSLSYLQTQQLANFYTYNFLYQQVIVTQTGLQYVLIGASNKPRLANHDYDPASYIFNSSDFFNTNYTDMCFNLIQYWGTKLDLRNITTNPTKRNSYNNGLIDNLYCNGGISFSSNGSGIVFGYSPGPQTTMFVYYSPICKDSNTGWYGTTYYSPNNSTPKNGWYFAYNTDVQSIGSSSSGYRSNPGGGAAISDNGKYIVMYSLIDNKTNYTSAYISYVRTDNSFNLTQVTDTNVMQSPNFFNNIPYYTFTSTNPSKYSHVTIDNYGNAYFSTSNNNGIYTKFNFFVNPPAKPTSATVIPLNTTEFYKPYNNPNNNFTTIALSSGGKYTVIMDSNLNQVIYINK